MAIAYPTIPSASRSLPAPVPGGGSIAQLAAMPRVTGSAVPGAEAPIAGMAPAGAPGVPSSGYTNGAFNVSGVGVPFNPQSFVGSDAYNFIRDQGMDAIQKSAATKGTFLSGGTLKDLARFGQGNAATFWGQQLAHDTDMARINAGISEGNANRSLSGLSSLAGLGFNAAQGMGNAYQGYGMAGAGGTIGAQNAVNQGIGGVANTLGGFFAQQRARQQAPALPGPGGVLN